MKSKGFTLIELLAVIIILGIIAAILVPIVSSTINNSEETINKKSVDSYGKAIEVAIKNYRLLNGVNPSEISDIEIKYTGNDVNCNITKIYEDGTIYLSECIVEDMEVKDERTDDGWYHYGKKFKYKVYAVGDVVTYNGIDFYVIEEDNENSDSITLLKAEPLSIDQVERYSVDENGISHLNRNTDEYVGEAESYLTSYGTMAYYSNIGCGYSSGYLNENSCINSYADSDIKVVVDNWSKNELNEVDLKTDELSYSARLITTDELTKLGCSVADCSSSYEWITGSRARYEYWTMNFDVDSDFTVYVVWRGKSLDKYKMYSGTDIGVEGGSYILPAVRPVVTLTKSVLN